MINLKIYKRDQGRYVRIPAFLISAIMFFFLCLFIYDLPPTSSFLWNEIYRQDIFGAPLVIRVMTIPTAVIFLVGLYIIFRVFNITKVAEFLIETEGELRKVSWPPKKGFLGASAAVIVVIIAMIAYLSLVDFGLSQILSMLKIGF